MGINLRKLGFLSSLAVYLLATLLMFVFTKFLIPFLSEISGQEIILFWFIVAGLGVFLPMWCKKQKAHGLESLCMQLLMGQALLPFLLDWFSF